MLSFCRSVLRNLIDDNLGGAEISVKEKNYSNYSDRKELRDNFLKFDLCKPFHEG